jgi:hypothetical protein
LTLAVRRGDSLAIVRAPDPEHDAERAMAGAHEIAEHIEHASGHGEHGHAALGGGPGKAIGITMAILGVMLALCAAMVGEERTEHIATLIEQSNRFGLYQAETMKYRVADVSLEVLHALTPSRPEVAKFEHAIKDIHRVGGKADDEDTQELKAAIELSTRELAEVLSPDWEDEVRIGSIVRKYKHDMKEAREDAECYDDMIGAHSRAAMWYERAQLCAEIGIVIASVALLLASRWIWSVSLVFGVACAGIIGATYAQSARALVVAEHKIQEAQKRTEEIEDSESPGTEERPIGNDGGARGGPQAGER